MSDAEVTSDELLALRARREAEREAMGDDDVGKRRALHFMHCCKCGAQMDEIVFRGVRVDKCLECGGVYLDDGELEQLVGKPGWIEELRKFFGS
ncbi:MAG: zf-TFIIB domain-containing protein [Myxococcota bacterium]